MLYEEFTFQILTRKKYVQFTKKYFCHFNVFKHKNWQNAHSKGKRKFKKNEEKA